MAEVPWCMPACLGPEATLFSEWFVCEFAPMDRFTLLLPFHPGRTATAWPPVTVNRGQSIYSFSLNGPFHSLALGLCSYLASFICKRKRVAL